MQEVTRAAKGALEVFATLSTAANSEVNKETTMKIIYLQDVGDRHLVQALLLGDLLAIAATYWTWQPRRPAI